MCPANLIFHIRMTYGYLWEQTFPCIRNTSVKIVMIREWYIVDFFGEHSLLAERSLEDFGDAQFLRKMKRICVEGRGNDSHCRGI